MFCYNCGNETDTAGECPLCKRLLPPLNPALAERALNFLNSRRDDSPAEDSEFVAGELPIYEKYEFTKKRKLFGLMNVFGFFFGLFADSDRDLPDHWQRVFTELTIHRDKLILRQYKKLWIPITPLFKTYGEKEKILPIKDVTALVKRGEDLLAVQFGGQEFSVPTAKGFNPGGLAYNLQAANPAIQYSN